VLDLSRLPPGPAGWSWDFVTLLPCGFGVAVGHQDAGGGARAADLFVTEDGGRLWRQTSILRTEGWPAASGRVGRFASLAMPTPTGIALAWEDPWLLDGSQSHVVYSHDRGGSWGYRCLGDANPYLALDRGGRLLALNDGYYLASPDGGRTWAREYFVVAWPPGYGGARVALLRELTFTGPDLGYALVVHWRRGFRGVPDAGLLTLTRVGRAGILPGTTGGLVMAPRVLTATKTAVIDHLTFAPDGSRLAAACSKSNARVWDLASGRGQALKGARDLDFVGFAGGPDELVGTKWDTPAGLRDLRTGAVRLLGPAAGPGYCWDTDLSPDGRRLVRVEREGVVCRAVADARVLWTARWRRDSSVRHRARFDGGGTRVFFVGRRVAILDADSGTEVGGFDRAFHTDVTLDMAAVSPDGRWLAVRGSDGLQVRDTADGRLVLECPHITYGYGLAFTPDGTRLAATRFGGYPGVEFWDVPGWRACEPWTSAIGPVRAVAFSPDGRLAATGGYGGQVAVWDFLPNFRFSPGRPGRRPGGWGLRHRPRPGGGQAAVAVEVGSPDAAAVARLRSAAPNPAAAYKKGVRTRGAARDAPGGRNLP
jgi:hypothetical protein